MINRLLLIFVNVILLIGLISAADFSISSVQQITQSAYKGDFVQFKGTILASSDNYCYIECQYNVVSESGYVSDSGNYPATSLDAGESQEFPFKIRADGSNGFMSQTITITCDRVANYINCWPDSTNHQQLVNFSFLYAGDRTCTATKEKCQDYGNFTGTSDCNCPLKTECRPNGDRNPDSKGCQSYCGNGVYENQYEDCSCNLDFTCPTSKRCKPDNNRTLDSDKCTTYCGNRVCEKNYENCSSCSQDCKSCDMVSCVRGSECQGGYCVWGFCWYLSFRKDDSHCDRNENCANSPNDCACLENERCNGNGVCEVYCGNGICEYDEIGICNADCKWCGDGLCQTSESCSSCEPDCGRCRETIINKNNSVKVNNDTQTKNNSHGTNNYNSNTNLSNRTNNSNNTNNFSQENLNKNRSITDNQNNPFTGKTNYKQFFYFAFIIIIILVLIFITIYKIYEERMEKKGMKKIEKKFIICKNCKKKIDPDSIFCTYCGYRINSTFL